MRKRVQILSTTVTPLGPDQASRWPYTVFLELQSPTTNNMYRHKGMKDVLTRTRRGEEYGAALRGSSQVVWDWVNKLCFVYLLQAGEHIYSRDIHTTWEEPFSAALYISGQMRQNKDKGKKCQKYPKFWDLQSLTGRTGRTLGLGAIPKWLFKYRHFYQISIDILNLHSDRFIRDVLNSTIHILIDNNILFIHNKPKLLTSSLVLFYGYLHHFFHHYWIFRPKTC